MVETRTRLNEIVAELHEALESATDLDAEVRQELREAAEDIQRALDPEDESELSPPLRQRLTAALEDFEQSHPRITGIVGRIADTLSDLGI